MAVRRSAMIVVAVAALVTGCGTGAGTSTSEGSTVTSQLETIRISPSTSGVPTTSPEPSTIPSSTAAPTTQPPSVAAPPPPVVVSPTVATRTSCQAGFGPPPEATNLQSMVADIDGNGVLDAIWLYDLADGPHLQIRSDRGATDAIRLGYGQQAAALGLAQVDLSVGAADPGTAEEILAAAVAGDGTRLVGVYTFALKTGCLDEFEFASGSPFVYLISRNGTYTGLQCVTDGVTAHLVGVSASPTSSTTYATDQLVFKRDGKRLTPVMSTPGTLTLPADQGALTAAGDITGCTLSKPLF